MLIMKNNIGLTTAYLTHVCMSVRKYPLLCVCLPVVACVHVVVCMCLQLMSVHVICGCVRACVRACVRVCIPCAICV